MIKEVVNNDNPFSKEIQYIEDNNVLGELKYSLIYERMEVDNILVKEEYRGRGIGTKLMSYLVSEAIHYKVINITLEVRVSNISAINLYKKFLSHKLLLSLFYLLLTSL